MRRAPWGGSASRTLGTYGEPVSLALQGVGLCPESWMTPAPWAFLMAADSLKIPAFPSGQTQNPPN